MRTRSHTRDSKFVTEAPLDGLTVIQEFIRNIRMRTEEDDELHIIKPRMAKRPAEGEDGSQCDCKKPRKEQEPVVPDIHEKIEGETADLEE